VLVGPAGRPGTHGTLAGGKHRKAPTRRADRGWGFRASIVDVDATTTYEVGAADPGGLSGRRGALAMRHSVDRARLPPRVSR